ncbi:hypothetical protein HY636_00670, partial [Candidatus Woesearchaeota archaeon]|nr:hypothetical protein [Candidatus Woesearchaeota archaeon]
MELKDFEKWVENHEFYFTKQKIADYLALFSIFFYFVGFILAIRLIDYIKKIIPLAKGIDDIIMISMLVIVIFLMIISLIIKNRYSLSNKEEISLILFLLGSKLKTIDIKER